MNQIQIQLKYWGVTSLARTLMNQHGLQEWNFEYDRARRRAGCCMHGRKTITLSYHYVSRNLHEEAEIKDTILHEISHALAGPGQGHGPKWKAICRKIGARPVRCYSSKVDMPKGRYKATCPNCQKPYFRHRRPRGTYYYCPPCGPEKGKIAFTCG